MKARRTDLAPPSTPEVSLDDLSGREYEILQLLARGGTNSEIGGDLGLSVHAVKFHLASVYRKLGVSNRTEAAVRFTSMQATYQDAAAEGWS